MSVQTFRFLVIAGLLVFASPFVKAQEASPAERAYDQRVRQLKQALPDRPRLQALAALLDLNNLPRESAEPQGAFLNGSLRTNDSGKVLTFTFLHLKEIEIQIRPVRDGSGFVAEITKQGGQYPGLKASVKRLETNLLYLQIEAESAIVPDVQANIDQPTKTDLFFDFSNADFKAYVKFLAPGRTGEFFYVGRIR